MVKSVRINKNVGHFLGTYDWKFGFKRFNAYINICDRYANKISCTFKFTPYVYFMKVFCVSDIIYITEKQFNKTQFIY